MHPVREVFLIILIAYLSYVTAELLEMSGIMTLFCCGITMSQYTFYNISKKSQRGARLAVDTLGHAAEAFLFTYLGLSLIGISEEKFSGWFTAGVMLAGVLARACAIFIPIGLLMLCRKCKAGLSFKQLATIWFSGIIRGAIAFALSLQVQHSLSPNRSIIVSTTLIVVLVTTVVLGGLMSIFAKMIGLSKERALEQNMYA